MSDLATNIASKDDIKLLKKKIQILKEAVRSQRKDKEQLQKLIQQQKQKNWKTEHQLKKKQEKNETLLTQIRQLKDTLVVQRNQKQKFIEELSTLKKPNLANTNTNQIDKQPANSSNASTMGSYLYFWK